MRQDDGNETFPIISSADDSNSTFPIMSQSAIPSQNVLELFIGYDSSWRNSFSSTSESTNYINAMLTHMQSFMCLSSLGTQIRIQVHFITPSIDI